MARSWDRRWPATDVGQHASPKADAAPPRRASRRAFLQAGAVAASAGALPDAALAQADGGDAQLARLRGGRRILLRGGVVLTLDLAVGDFTRADVLIEDGKIREVRPEIAIAADTAEIIDATNRIVCPGFVDTHSHSYQGLLRGFLPNGVVFPDYDRDIQNNLTAHYTPADAYAGVLVTALAMIDMGTTCMVDISQVAHTPEHSDANIAALRDAGMRAVFAYSRGIGPGAKYPTDLARMMKAYFSSADQLLTPALAVSTDPKVFAVAREMGVRAVMHVRLNSAPLIALGRAGLMKAGDEYVHCTHLNDEAWKMIKDTGGRTSHSPPLEMAMGHGFPSIQDALDHGMRPSLSCDHAATTGMDMFGMMRTTFNLQRLFIQQRQRNGEQNVPPLLTCREVLEFATIEGARCADLERRTGTLTPGKDADVLMLRFDDPNIWPLNNAWSAVVNLMHPGHVENVFIAGKVKKWRGALVDVDRARVLKLVAEARDAVVRRSGLPVNLLG